MRMESTQLLRAQEQTALKDQHRQEILDAGMALCLEKGVAEVEMKDVATAARVSRATLYRYFPSKKALIYEILRHQAAEKTAGYHTDRQAFSGNGHAKFSQFVAQLVDAYVHFPELYRFMGMVDFYYGTHDAPEELMLLYREVFGGLLVEDTPHLYLEEGQQDGSVRADLDPRIYTATVIATLVSLSEQVAANREATQLLYGLARAEVLIETAAQALLHAAQA
ncbi:MAG: TetR/AcrR family transcriptional regulator [Anaerolineales bacterium]|nr:TetR/AcrR family transcriptional regulator [Anaerolineales bacterium]